MKALVSNIRYKLHILNDHQDFFLLALSVTWNFQLVDVFSPIMFESLLFSNQIWFYYSISTINLFAVLTWNFLHLVWIYISFDTSMRKYLFSCTYRNSAKFCVLQNSSFKHIELFWNKNNFYLYIYNVSEV